MRNEQQRLTIAFLTWFDSQDRRSWSGAFYYMAQALQKYCGEVIHIGPIDASREKLIGKMVHKSAQVLLKKQFVYDQCFLVAKKYASVAAQWLADHPVDLIIAPGGGAEIAFLETDLPIVLVEDATYGLLIDYYPEYSHLLKRSIYELNTVEHLALEKASVLLSASEWAARSAIEDYQTDPRKVQVIPFGANLEYSPSQEIALAKKPSDRCRLLFVGVDWVRKGGAIAFETLLHLEAMGIRAELIVCGCIPPQTVSHAHMTIVPFLDKNNEKQRHELEKLYMTADFLLLPTRQDAYGIVFCEANAFGVPAITTYTGGVSGVIKEGENGFLLPYSAGGAEYADVIATLYHNDRRYAELVRTSRAAFDNRLNWDVWGRAVQAAIASLVH